MLTLREFVRDSLVEVVEGIGEAKPTIEAKGGQLSPRKVYGYTNAHNLITTEDGRPITVVQFDVALTVREEAGSNSKVGVVAGVFGAGVAGTEKAATTGVSRLQFSVQVALP